MKYQPEQDGRKWSMVHWAHGRPENNGQIQLDTSEAERLLIMKPKIYMGISDSQIYQYPPDVGVVQCWQFAPYGLLHDVTSTNHSQIMSYNDSAQGDELLWTTSSLRYVRMTTLLKGGRGQEQSKEGSSREGGGGDFVLCSSTLTLLIFVNTNPTKAWSFWYNCSCHILAFYLPSRLTRTVVCVTLWPVWINVEHEEYEGTR